MTNKLDIGVRYDGEKKFVYAKNQQSAIPGALRSVAKELGANVSDDNGQLYRSYQSERAMNISMAQSDLSDSRASLNKWSGYGGAIERDFSRSVERSNERLDEAKSFSFNDWKQQNGL